MWTVRVVVVYELAQHRGEVARSGDQQVVEAFAAQRADEAFGDRVGPRRLDWGADDADVGAVEYRVEGGGELAVPVTDQEAELLGAVVEVQEQVAGLRARVGFQNPAMASDQRCQAAGSYSLISPPRTGRRRILPQAGSGTGTCGRGGRSRSARCGRRML